ncbi:MAG: helix-turn-helix transcriptional regulator [Pseudomonadota bacterium]
MPWSGANLKALAKEKGITLTKLSEHLEVSRQTVTAWTKGKVPKGDHLIELSMILEINPGYFFYEDETLRTISVPMHRKRGVAKVTEKTEQDSFQLAKQYEKLFIEAPDPGLVPVLRVKHRDDKNARALAKELRKLSGIEGHMPMDYKHTFYLLSLLSIVPIFRYFPDSVKDYAFYCRIDRHRVVFVDNNTNVLDLIFPLLHETIHAIRDEEQNAIDDPVEEEFCDLVANYVQFPSDYVQLVYDTITGRRIDIQINRLKEFGKKNGHSLFGIAKEIKKINPALDLNVGGANTNLKKEFSTIGNILFDVEDVRENITRLNALSPLFVEILRNQIDNATPGKAAEWLGLESMLDGKQVIDELKRISSSENL